ncbi:MAG TPA: MBL fold metallo-hydrolase, partial [Roseiflexaceae bacterium]|nr:MBL fold metallo-hydrolase [Roseiflexaceae bacterium]
MTEPTPKTDKVKQVTNGGWDPRVLICRSAPTVDAFVVITDRYVVLIDTLVNGATAEGMLKIAQPHLEGRQLLVVCTHAHWDHAWGNHLFAGPEAAHPAPIFGTQHCAELMRSDAYRQKLEEMREREPKRFKDVVITPPTITFEERLRIEGGDLTLELLRTPGHTADHLAVFIPEIRMLLAGDAVELPFPFPEKAETLPQLRATLAALYALAPRQALYCHAPESVGPELIRRNIDYFDTLERRCRAALATGARA